MSLKRSHPEPVLIRLPEIDERRLPQDLEALQQRAAECERRAERKLRMFREGLKEFSGRWVRDLAKQVAIRQNEHTLELGRRGVQALKRKIEALAERLPERIDSVFVPEMLDTGAASSGQVALVLERRVRQAIGQLLGELFPILTRAGYEREPQWFDDDQRPLELPADLKSLLEDIVDALAESKVCEAKIRYFDQQSKKRAAERLWEET